MGEMNLQNRILEQEKRRPSDLMEISKCIVRGKKKKRKQEISGTSAFVCLPSAFSSVVLSKRPKASQIQDTRCINELHPVISSSYLCCT